MWKMILSSLGFLTLPVLVLLVQLSTSSSTGPGGNWFAIPIYALYWFPPFWLVCLVGGLIGLGLGVLLDGTPKVLTKPQKQA